MSSETFSQCFISQMDEMGKVERFVWEFISDDIPVGKSIGCIQHTAFEISAGLTAVQQEFIATLEPLVRYANAVDSVAKILNGAVERDGSRDARLIRSVARKLRGLGYKAEAKQLKAMSTTYHAGVWARDQLHHAAQLKLQNQEPVTEVKAVTAEFWMVDNLPEPLQNMARILERSPEYKLTANSLSKQLNEGAISKREPSQILQDYKVKWGQWIHKYISREDRVYRLLIPTENRARNDLAKVS